MSDVKFNDQLRDMARELASGSKEELRVTISIMQQQFPSQEEKNYASYLRMTMGRLSEVKAAGSLSIRRKMVDDVESEHYGVEYFSITINRNKAKRVFTKDDLPAIEARSVIKFAKTILQTIPNVTHLSGDELQGAVKGIALYQDMIKKIAEIE